MMRTICIALFCLMAKAGTTQDVNLFFEFNKSNLQQDEFVKLEQLVKDYRQSRFRIVLQGYADSVGGNSYNYNLSGQRGNAVKRYLTTRGVDQHDITMEVYGEEKANEDQVFSRRVSVFMVKADVATPSNYHQVMESITPVREKVEISTKDTAVIRGTKGTTVTIPANAFKDRNGNDVTGPVKVEMTEYYSLQDLISKGLTTISDGKLLVSGGVVDIRAYSDTTELFLKDSMGIKLRFPNTASKKFSTFYGTRMPDGTMNWEPEGEPEEQEEETGTTNAVPPGGDLDPPLQRVPDCLGGSVLITYRRTSEGIVKAIWDPMIGKFRIMTPKDDSLVYGYGSGIECDPCWMVRNSLSTELYSKRMNWINCDYFYKDSSTREIELIVKVSNPGVFVQRVLLIFDDIKSVLSVPYNRQNNYRLKALLPTSRSVRLLVVGNQKDKLFYHFERVTLQPRKLEKVELKESTPEGFESMLKSI